MNLCYVLNRNITFRNKKQVLMKLILFRKVIEAAAYKVKCWKRG
jgi:putative flippase GtrA